MNPCKPVNECRSYNLIAWADQTHFHGVKEYFDASNITSKIIWGLVIIGYYTILLVKRSRIKLSYLAGSVLISTWQLYNLFSEYLQEPYYTTNIFIEHRLWIEFPNITICPYQRLAIGRHESMN